MAIGVCVCQLVGGVVVVRGAIVLCFVLLCLDSVIVLFFRLFLDLSLTVFVYLSVL